MRSFKQYLTRETLDSDSDGDVFDVEHRNYWTEIMDKLNPYARASKHFKGKEMLFNTFSENQTDDASGRGFGQSYEMDVGVATEDFIVHEDVMFAVTHEVVIYDSTDEIPSPGDEEFEIQINEKCWKFKDARPNSTDHLDSQTVVIAHDVPLAEVQRNISEYLEPKLLKPDNVRKVLLRHYSNMLRNPDQREILEKERPEFVKKWAHLVDLEDIGVI